MVNGELANGCDVQFRCSMYPLSRVCCCDGGELAPSYRRSTFDGSLLNPHNYFLILSPTGPRRDTLLPSTLRSDLQQRLPNV